MSTPDFFERDLMTALGALRKARQILEVDHELGTVTIQRVLELVRDAALPVAGVLAAVQHERELAEALQPTERPPLRVIR